MKFKIIELPVPGIDSFDVSLPIGTKFVGLDIKGGVPHIIARAPSSLSELNKKHRVTIVTAGQEVDMSEKAVYLGTLSAVPKTQIVGVEPRAMTFYFFGEEELPVLI